MMFNADFFFFFNLVDESLTCAISRTYLKLPSVKTSLRIRINLVDPTSGKLTCYSGSPWCTVQYKKKLKRLYKCRFECKTHSNICILYSLIGRRANPLYYLVCFNINIQVEVYLWPPYSSECDPYPGPVGYLLFLSRTSRTLGFWNTVSSPAFKRHFYCFPGSHHPCTVVLTELLPTAHVLGY